MVLTFHAYTVFFELCDLHEWFMVIYHYDFIITHDGSMGLVVPIHKWLMFDS